jgi:putative transposase
MGFYRRRLPHLDVVGEPLFVTFRLHGSLPANRCFVADRLANDGKAFAAMDRLLDKSDCGPLYLRMPEIARLVVASLLRGEEQLGQYKLHAYVVMPNHVHLLATGRIAAARWLGPLKGFTAHEGNRLLGRSGEPFWQHESYDHLVRGGECERVQRYIEWNPVRAGLARAPEEFRWSSAAKSAPG